MAVQSFSCAPNNALATNFRAWGSAISAALQAYGGLAKTTDTGQIDWTSVALPGVGVTAGYEMYKFTDALQATAPVFIKIEYGTSSTTAQVPQIWVSVGTGTDGAGNLTSLANTGVSVTSKTPLNGSNLSSSDTTARQCFVNGDASTLVMALWNLATGTHACILVVERNRDTSGNPTGDGVQIIWMGANGGTFVQTVLMHNQVAQVGQSASFGSQGLVVVPQGASSSGIKDGVMSVYPIMTGGGPKQGAPSKFIVAHNTADLGAGGTFSNVHYGVSHNWVSWSGPRNLGGFNLAAVAVRTD